LERFSKGLPKIELYDADFEHGFRKREPMNPALPKNITAVLRTLKDQIEKYPYERKGG